MGTTSFLISRALIIMCFVVSVFFCRLCCPSFPQVPFSMLMFWFFSFMFETSCGCLWLLTCPFLFKQETLKADRKPQGLVGLLSWRAFSRMAGQWAEGFAGGLLNDSNWRLFLDKRPFSFSREDFLASCPGWYILACWSLGSRVGGHKLKFAQFSLEMLTESFRVLLAASPAFLSAQCHTVPDVSSSIFLENKPLSLAGREKEDSSCGEPIAPCKPRSPVSRLLFLCDTSSWGAFWKVHCPTPIGLPTERTDM